MKLMSNVASAIDRSKVKIKANSPEILIVCGIVGVVGGVVTACVATVKAADVIEEGKEQLETIREFEPDENDEEECEYDENCRKKDITTVYVKTGLKVAGLYLFPAVVLGLSIGTIVTSNNILKRRNTVITASYTALNKAYKQYRGRVVERFGEDVDHELLYNIKKQEIEEVTVDAKGKEKIKKRKVNVAEGPIANPYARIFDESSKLWKRNAELNKQTILKILIFAQQKFDEKGYLYLNDVYEMLGFDKTEIGNHVGWFKDLTRPDEFDNKIDFGLFGDKDGNISKEKALFINGQEKSIILDFNVDGVIDDLVFGMGRKRRA